MSEKFSECSLLQVRLSAILAATSILATRQDLHIVLLPIIFGPVSSALFVSAAADNGNELGGHFPDDEVVSAAASCLAPVSDKLAVAMPEASVVLLGKLGEVLPSLDELPG